MVVLMLGGLFLSAFLGNLRLYFALQKVVAPHPVERVKEDLFALLTPLYETMSERNMGKMKPFHLHYQEEEGILSLIWTSEWKADIDPLFCGFVECHLEYHESDKVLLLQIFGRKEGDSPPPCRTLYRGENIEGWKPALHRFALRKGVVSLASADGWHDKWALSEKEDPDLLRLLLNVDGRETEIYLLLPSSQKSPLVLGEV